MTHDVTFGKCPQCGASLARDCSRCVFCGAMIQLSDDHKSVTMTGVSCPSCGSCVGAGERFCGRCSTRLIEPCPKSTCRQENPVWSIFCSRCGSDLLETRLALLENDRLERTRQLEECQAQLEEVQARVPRARTRKIVVQSLAVLSGLALAFALRGLHWLLALGVLAVSLLVALTYHPGEMQNLALSASFCLRNIDRIQATLNQIAKSQEETTKRRTHLARDHTDSP